MPRSSSSRFIPGQLSQEQYSLRRDLATSEELKKHFASPQFQEWVVRQSRKAATNFVYTACALAGLLLLCLLAVHAVVNTSPDALARQVQHVRLRKLSLSFQGFISSGLQCQYVISACTRRAGICIDFSQSWLHLIISATSPMRMCCIAAE